MIGIIVHSASNPTYTLQRQSCVVASERLIFLKMRKRNHRTRVSFEIRKGKVGRVEDP